MKGSESALAELERKHKTLDKELHMLERRAHLTPTEQRQATELKKQKLATKDRIYAIRRDE